MERELEIEVKIISNEMIKSSLPPPSRPKTFSLSLLDQFYCIYYIPVILFYTPKSTTPKDEVDISVLKKSLSKTLDQFYPLSGRLLDESTISCNNQGIPFIETKVDCNLSVVLTSPDKLKLLAKFIPPPELQDFWSQPISELVPFAIQVNVFRCGGVVIGCLFLHKLFDAASIGTFLTNWSALASNRLNDVVQPDYETTSKTFPPSPTAKPISFAEIFSEIPPRISNSISLRKSFVFDSVAISKLKARATSDLIPKPTKFEAVTGFIWEQTLATMHDLGTKVEHTTLSFAVNIRSRMIPPLPRGSMGNLIMEAQARAQVPDISSSSSSSFRHQQLVKEIHSAASDTIQKIPSQNYKDEDAAEEIRLIRKAMFRRLLDAENGIFGVTSWCKMGLDEADFGFGKPVWIVPIDRPQISPSIMNSFTFVDQCHSIAGDGIEVWLLLEEKLMQKLESNPDFLAFASPN